MNFIGRLFLVLVLISNLGYGVSYAVDNGNTVKKPVHRKIPQVPPAKAPTVPMVPPIVPPPHPEVPIPPIITEPGGVGTIEEAISHIWVTVFYNTRFPDYVTTNADIGKVDAQDMDDFIQDKSAPNSEKFHLNDHYELRDPRITEKFIEMKTSGFGGVSIHTDFANIFELGPDDQTTSDFNRLVAEGKFKKNKDGTDIDAVVEFKKLLAAGFKLVGSDQKLSENLGKPGFQYTISGPSVEKLKPGEEGVIFHLKRYANYILKNGVKIARNARSGEVNYSLPTDVVIDKDNNANPHSRANTTFEFKDPKIVMDMVADHESMARTFGDGGTVAEVVATPIKNYTYANGSIEVDNIAAYDPKHPADRFNPNIHITELLKDAIYTFKTANRIALDPNYDRPPADPTQKVTIDSLQMMAYVFTDRDLLEAITRFFALKTGATGLFLFDEQFADMDGAGFAALFAGVPLNREMGGLLQDTGGVLSDNPNIKAFIYQRWVQGTSEPFLNHGKTIVIKGSTNGIKWTKVRSLSFNISGHAANAENAMWVTVTADSEFGQDSEDRLGAIINDEQSQGFVVEIKRGELRNFLSHLTGIDLENIDLKETFNLFDLIGTAQNKSPSEISKIYKEYISIVEGMYKAQTTAKLPQAEFDQRMQNINGFFSFIIKDQTGKSSKEITGLSFEKFIAALDNIAYKGENPDEQRGDLRFALSDKKFKDMTPAEVAALDAKVDAATKAEGRSEPLPPLGEKPVFAPEKIGESAVAKPLEKTTEKVAEKATEKVPVSRDRLRVKNPAKTAKLERPSSGPNSEVCRRLATLRRAKSRI